MSRRELTRERLREIADYAERHIRIRDAETARQVPLRFNRVQRQEIEEGEAFLLRHVTEVAIKPRQVGSTTGKLALSSSIIANEPNVTICWVEKEEKDIKRTVRKFRQMWDSMTLSPGSNLPEIVSNSEEQFVLANGSMIIWQTGGGQGQASSDPGRGEPVDLFILAEFAYWSSAAEAFDAIQPAADSTFGAVLIDSTISEKDTAESYLLLVDSIRRGILRGSVFFWPWWYRLDYRAPSPARAPYDADEVALMRRHGLDLFQIQWRRQRKAHPLTGWRFSKTYPESLEEALERGGAKAFPPHLVREWRRRFRDGDWPHHFDATGLAQVLPPELRVRGYDPLTDPDTFRLYELPRLPAPEEQRQARFAEDNVVDLFRGQRQSKPGLGYTLGVDSSKGLEGSDAQTAVMIGPDAETCAVLRCRMPELTFAAHVTRLALWYGATAVVETNDPSGALVHRYLAEHVSADEVERRGVPDIVCQPLEGVEAWRADAKNRPELEELVVDYVRNELVEMRCPWFAEECIDWDPKLRKSRKGSVDNVFDGHGIAYTHRAKRSLAYQASERDIQPMAGVKDGGYVF